MPCATALIAGRGEFGVAKSQLGPVIFHSVVDSVKHMNTQPRVFFLPTVAAVLCRLRNGVPGHVRKTLGEFIDRFLTKMAYDAKETDGVACNCAPAALV